MKVLLIEDNVLFAKAFQREWKKHFPLIQLIWLKPSKDIYTEDLSGYDYIITDYDFDGCSFNGENINQFCSVQDCKVVGISGNRNNTFTCIHYLKDVNLFDNLKKQIA